MANADVELALEIGVPPNRTAALRGAGRLATLLPYHGKRREFNDRFASVESGQDPGELLDRDTTR
jgi:hypothetical protein